LGLFAREVAVAKCGIQRIDDLNSGSGSPVPIGPHDSDTESVGVIQTLLAGQGQKGLPNLLSPAFGSFGPITTQAVRNFRAQQGLPAADVIDVAGLQQLVRVPAATPVASRGYLSLVLDFDYTGLVKVLSVVAQMEGAGKFAALNLNTDKAGLSFGLIQWAQKPGRLNEILAAFSAALPADFIQIFGVGDPPTAQGLLAHTSKTNGGIQPATGETTDPNFDLVREPWVSRFRAAAASVAFQKVQVSTALADFEQSLANLRKFAFDLRSERSIAFMLDLANQFGDAGARKIYQTEHQDGMSEEEILQACADESVQRIQDPFKPGTQLRRQHFLTTGFLSDEPFLEGTASVPA
jgi:peptidoglycan hydrolase-like protein with peptidoglycan-binding domain